MARVGFLQISDFIGLKLDPQTQDRAEGRAGCPDEDRGGARLRAHMHGSVQEICDRGLVIRPWQRAMASGVVYQLSVLDSLCSRPCRSILRRSEVRDRREESAK